MDELKQIINIVAQLDPAAAQRAADELRKLNEDRARLSEETDQKIKSALEKAAEERAALSKRELNELEDRLVSRYEKEIDQLRRLEQANEEKYRAIVDKVKRANEEQRDLAVALNDKQLADYEQYLKNRDVIHRRQLDAEKERESGTDSTFLGKATRTVKDAASEGLGGAIGIIAKSLPSATEEDKRNKIGAETLDAVVKSRTATEALVNIGNGLLRYAQMSFEEDMRRTKEALRAAGGTLQFGDPAMLDQMKEVRKSLENDSKVLRDNVKAIDATLAVLGRSRVEEFGEGSQRDQRETFHKVRQSADLLGEGWAEHARKIADLSRKEIDSATGRAVSIDQAVQNMNRAFFAAQQVTREFGEIDLQTFTRNWFSLQEVLRPFGYSMEDTTRLLIKFGRELDRGVISLSDLVQWSTGVTRADDASRSFLFQEMLKTAQSKPEFAELANTLAQAQGQGPLAQSYLLEALMEDNKPELQRLGLSTAGSDQIKDLLNATQNSMANRFGGGTNSLKDQAAADFFWRQAAPWAGQQLEGKTIEQRRLLTQGGGEGKDQVLMTLEESNSYGRKQVEQLDRLILLTREKESKGSFFGAVDNLIGKGPAPYSGNLLSERELAATRANRDPTGSEFYYREDRTKLAEGQIAWAKKYAAMEQSGQDPSSMGAFPMYHNAAAYDETMKSYIPDDLEPVIERAIAKQGIKKADIRSQIIVSATVAAETLKDSELLAEKLRAAAESLIKEHLPTDSPQERAIQQLQDSQQSATGYKKP